MKVPKGKKIYIAGRKAPYKPGDEIPADVAERVGLTEEKPEPKQEQKKPKASYTDKEKSEE